MTHGVAATKGHLSNNGGLRGHSVDSDVFPWIPYKKGDRIVILTPSGDTFYPAVSDWGYAEDIAAVMKIDNIRSFAHARAYDNHGLATGHWEVQDVR